MSKKMFLKFGQIKTDGLQIRAVIVKDAVREYAEAEREGGAVFPPLTVFVDKKGLYWLADGFHRLAAFKQNGKEKVACEVHEGEYADALRFALAANGSHGMRRTNDDKANAVKVAYEHRKVLGLPDVPSANSIAELVGVSHHTVEAQLGNLPSWRNAQERTGSDGKTRVLPPPPTRPPKKAEPVEAAEPADEPPPPPPPPVRPPAAVVPPPPPPERKKPGANLPLDGRGKPVPASLVETWNRRGEVADLARKISEVRVALRKAQDGKDPLWGEMNFSSTLAHLDMAYTEVSSAEPWCVCALCQGLGCKGCKGLGLLSEFRFPRVVPKEMR